ncbi:MAG: DUF1080 domain-containing protein [Prolixibacteraceae bacterium]|jgi:hypothetical protein|nr:DUF1080 domain-containing protein [Prolixibacteraceae bacterium]
MKTRKIAFLLGLLLLLLSYCTPSEDKDPARLYDQIDKTSTPNSLTTEEQKKGWQLLFDGKTTNGWHGYNLKGFPDCWVIENGVFTTTTKGGHEDLDIVTDREYRNYALSLDFKMMKGTNSGVIFQVAEDPKYKFPYETGPEFQIIDQANWPNPLKDWQICGANYAMYPPKSLPNKPIGEWNHLMLVVDGNHVTQIINGVVVVQYEKYVDEWKKLRSSGKWANFPDYGKFDIGHISLQNHGTQVWFQNIKLKEF